MHRYILASLATFALLASANQAAAQRRPDAPASDNRAATDDGSWYAEPSVVQRTPRMIIQQKAEMRAYQRIARMESMKWYGMSASRPLASTTPFMGIPSPRWQMPGGRPFAWTPSRGPSVIVVR